MDRDLTPEEQSEYEKSLKKRAFAGGILAYAVCAANFLLCMISRSGALFAAAVILLALAVFGRPQAKWVAVGIGIFYASVGAMTVADIPAVGAAGRSLYPYELAACAELAHGIISSVLFLKSGLIASHLEYRASVIRKHI